MKSVINEAPTFTPRSSPVLTHLRLPTTAYVPAVGLEPTYPFGHWYLKPARIPNSARQACDGFDQPVRLLVLRA